MREMTQEELSIFIQMNAQRLAQAMMRAASEYMNAKVPPGTYSDNGELISTAMTLIVAGYEAAYGKGVIRAAIMDGLAANDGLVETIKAAGTAGPH